MRLRKFKAFMGPFYWAFKDPDTGYLLTGKNKEDLLSRIVAYRSQNQLEEIAMLSSVVECYLCAQPDHRHMCEDGPELERGFWAYFRGGVALVKAVALGKMVSQELGETRALQCAACPLNEAYNRKAVEKATDELMIAAVEGKRAPTSVHKQLGNCAACSCCLKFKVFAEGPFTHTSEEREKMESVDCWQVRK